MYINKLWKTPKSLEICGFDQFSLILIRNGRCLCLAIDHDLLRVPILIQNFGLTVYACKPGQVSEPSYYFFLGCTSLISFIKWPAPAYLSIINNT